MFLLPTALNRVAHVCQTIPRHVMERTYGINIIRPREDQDPDRVPTSEEMLRAYGCKAPRVTRPP